MADVASKLRGCRSIHEVLELVRRCVREVLGLSRGGIMLGLQDLPLSVLSYHPLGSNIIVLNRRALLLTASMARDSEVLASVLFYAILREYLRSLGIVDGRLLRRYAAEVCERALGEDHPASVMARLGVSAVAPWLSPSEEEGELLDAGELLIIRGEEPSDLAYV